MVSSSSTIVVAIGRQIGSGGTELGERLARRLGFAYVDRQVIQEAARCLGISRATADRYWAYARAWLYDRVRAADH